jgi:DNA-binding NarL/FixJ family response regulator
MPDRPRVLIADDHPGMAKALVRVLSSECDVVGVVADGSDVAGAVARLEPVVAVVDVNLPDVNGLEVCRRIVKANPRARVILITAMLDEAMRADVLAAGASAFVSKQAAGDQLIEVIRRVWAECSPTAPSLPVKEPPGNAAK